MDKDFLVNGTLFIGKTQINVRAEILPTHQTPIVVFRAGDSIVTLDQVNSLIEEMLSQNQWQKERLTQLENHLSIEKELAKEIVIKKDRFGI